MYYGIIMIAVLLFSLQFLFNQRFQKEYGSGLRPLLVFVLGYNIAGLLVLLVINGFRVEFTPFTLLLSFLWAVNGLILSFCSFKAFEKHITEPTDLAKYLSHVNHPTQAGHELVADEIAKYFVAR